MFVEREIVNMRVTLGHPRLVYFLPRWIRARASSHFRKAAAAGRISGSAIEKSTSSPHTKADPRLRFGTRECGDRTREYRLRGPSPGLLPIVALIVTFNERGSRCIYIQGGSLFMSLHRSANLSPIHGTRRR